MYGRDVIYAELYPQRVAKRGVIYASDVMYECDQAQPLRTSDHVRCVAIAGSSHLARKRCAWFAGESSGT
jgi:hypothetical protein